MSKAVHIWFSFRSIKVFSLFSSFGVRNQQENLLQEKTKRHFGRCFQKRPISFVMCSPKAAYYKYLFKFVGLFLTFAFSLSVPNALNEVCGQDLKEADLLTLRHKLPDFRCKRPNGDRRFSPTKTDEMESGRWNLRRAKEKERKN